MKGTCRTRDYCVQLFNLPNLSPTHFIYYCFFDKILFDFIFANRQELIIIYGCQCVV